MSIWIGNYREGFHYLEGKVEYPRGVEEGNAE